MDLTTTQIQQVNQFLERKKIDYIDVKFEVLDHMVSDIEQITLQKKVSFETAFAKVKVKWKNQFEETDSFLLGMGFLAPKIIISKAKKIYFNYYLLLMCSYFLPFLFLTQLDFSIQNPTEKPYFIFLRIIFVFCFSAFLWMFFMKAKTHKTTFGFILKTQSLNLIIGLMVLLTFLTTPKELNGINIGFSCAFVFSTYSYFHFFRKHQSIVKRIS